MELCPAGILCLAIGALITLRRKDFFFNMVVFAAVLQIFFGKGFIIKIGESVLALENLPFLILAAYSITNFKFDMAKQTQKNMLALLCCYCLSIILLVIFPSDAWVATGNVQWDDIIFNGVKPLHPTINSYVIQTTIKFISCLFIYLFIYNYWKTSDYKKFISKLSHIANYFLILGLVEFAIKNYFGLNETWGDLCRAFFGDAKNTVYAGRLRGFFYESNLFTREASHYAYSLFCVAIIKFADNIVNNRNKKIDNWIFLCFVLMLLSTSFLSVSTITTFILVFISYRWGVLRPITMKAEMIVLGILILALFLSSFALSFSENNFIGNRLNILINNFSAYFTFDISFNNIGTDGDSSTFIRILSIMQTFKLFLERPFFGYSLGTLTSHGSAATFLSHIGVVGFVCWLNYYMLKNPLFKEIKPCILPFFVGMMSYLVCNFFGGATGTSSFYLMMPLVFSISFCFIYQKHENLNSNNLL